jgi:hypothetical protein
MPIIAVQKGLYVINYLCIIAAIGTVLLLHVYSTYTHQSPCFKAEPGETQDRRRRTEIMHNTSQRPPHQNITDGFGQRPRPLHNRYTRTDTCVRLGMAVT